MEEKHFLWVLTLLFNNKSKIPILDTYPLYRNKIVCSFMVGTNKTIRQISQKSLGWSNIQGYLLSLFKVSESNQAFPKCIYFVKNCHRELLTLDYIKQFQNYDSSSPRVSFLQVSRNDFFRFIIMRIEYSKSGYLFSYSPNRLLTKNLIEQAESIFQQFHIYLQAAASTNR